jgi:hypothetical protein
MKWVHRATARSDYEWLSEYVWCTGLNLQTKDLCFAGPTISVTGGNGLKGDQGVKIGGLEVSVRDKSEQTNFFRVLF